MAAMNQNNFEFTTTDGTLLKGISWSQDEPPKAIIAIVHGHGEHKMRYQHVGEHFAHHGYSAFAFDLRGHGESAGKTGHSPTHDQLIDDVEQFLIKIRNTNNDIPIIIYGHSMGGNIVANYLLKRKTSELKGAIITSSLFKLGFEPPKWKVTLGNMMTNIWPSLTQPTDLDTKQISTDEREVEKYKEDPLVHGKMSAALFTGLFENGLWAIDHASELSVPTLLTHGTDDQITSPKGSEEFAAHAGEIVTLKLWEGMYHETHNERDKESVLNYTLDWVEKLVLS
jgi:alpha-beta hydrolase superfamily lysophospholipase